MPAVENPKTSLQLDDTITVIAIAVLAFIVADIAHEVFGHALGFYLAGGHSSMATTTRLIVWVKLADPQWRIFDLGGVAGNLAFALIGWLGQRFVGRLVRGNPARLRLFLWLVMAFSLFWATGYMIFCGAVGIGDWMALIKGSKFEVPGRVLFFVGGIALYRASVRLAASELRWIVPVDGGEAKSRAGRLLWISYVSGGVIACAGCILDPRGPMEILNSGALSSFAGAIGLLFVANRFAEMPREYSPVDAPMARGLAWILAASAGSIYYVAILGPGVLLWFAN